MRLLMLIAVMLLFASFVSAECIEPSDGMNITENVTFCSKTVDLPSGLFIGADDIVINCNTAILRGNSQEGTGITVEGRKNVMIENCNIVTYKIGVFVRDSSHITVTKNSLLKNRIGVRLLNAYENIISDNADKSTERPLSVVNSKFNVFLLGNKNIDQEFCEDNLCNKVADINPCENDDFYCSDSCNPANDNDCKAVEPEIVFNQTKEKIINTRKETPTAQVVQPQTMTLAQQKKGNVGWIIYPLLYVIAFFMLQFYTYVKKY